MLELIKEDLVYPGVPVYTNDTEIKNEKFVPSYLLLKQLSKKNPDHQFYFCLGADIVPSLPSWELYQELISNFPFIVMTRPGYQFDDSIFKGKEYIKINSHLDGSSTEIRSRINNLKYKDKKIFLGISGLTTKSVITYIIDNELYKVN